MQWCSVKLEPEEAEPLKYAFVELVDFTLSLLYEHRLSHSLHFGCKFSMESIDFLVVK